MDNQPTGELRKAVAAGDWCLALRLWEELAAGIREEIECGSCTPERMAEAGEFLEWAKRSVLCARAHAQAQLNALHAAATYEEAPPEPQSSLRTSG